LRGEWSFAFEGMQDDTFEQVSEAHVLEFGDGLQDFEQPLLDAHPGLNPVNLYKSLFDVSLCHGYQYTMVHTLHDCEFYSYSAGPFGSARGRLRGSLQSSAAKAEEIEVQIFSER
jgi:hypothetical protein